MSQSIRRRRIIALTVVGAVLAGGALVVGTISGNATPTVVASTAPAPTSLPTPRQTTTVPSRPAPTDSQPPAAAPAFNRSARSIDDPTSLWVVVDKARALNPVDYVPPDLVDVPVPYVWPPKLRAEASTAVVAMFAEFTAETGLQFQSQSAYRSYSTQVDLYSKDVAQHGQAVADTSTARPGTSEHQTGLAIDISALPGTCSLEPCFGSTGYGQWLAQNAWRFGFVLRYPADKVPITGFGYEPWHFRYIGVDVSTGMHQTGVTTIEEFFGLPAAPEYR
jgi:D-alanyl-D-alanine carboxypeptidase